MPTCEHGIGEARVQAWWAREERNGTARSREVCVCCGGPAAYSYQACKFCRSFAGRQTVF